MREFRQLTRIRQKLSDEDTIALLKKEKRGVLSVLGDNGYPYGMPMNHYYEDGILYFHGGRIGHKIDALRNNPKASYCVYDEGFINEGEWFKRVKSAIVFGKVELIEDTDKIIEISRKLSYKFTQDDDYINKEIEKSAAKTLMLALHIEHVSGKIVEER